MFLKKSKLSGFIFSAVTAMMLATSSSAIAKEMRVSSFEPDQGFFSDKVLREWINKVNPTLSKGNRFRLYPGSILGAPTAQQEMVKKGIADVALVVPTYNPGLFPLTSVVEVPGVAPTSRVGTRVLNTLLAEGMLGKEYDDYKVIALFSTNAYSLFTHSKAVRTPADLHGMKLRTPSPFGGKLLSLLGASGVSVPAPQVYENVDRRVLEGTIWTFDAYRSFRLFEVMPYVAKIALSSTPMAILMNKKTYESLPENDKQAIDKWAGASMSEWVANVVDTYDVEQQEQFGKDAKVHFANLSDDELKQWKEALKGADKIWLDMQSEFKVDGKEALAKAVEISGAGN